MAHFIAAVYNRDRRPAAFALVEQTPGPGAPVYHVRRLHELGEDGLAHVLNDLADHAEYAGQTVVVTTGGQRAADAIHDAGPSAVPVTLTGDGTPGTTDAIPVTPQVLVDTFERLYRENAVEAPGGLDEASSAIAALYRGADLDAAAPERDLPDEQDEDAAPAVIEQSGGAAGLSTGVIREDENAEMLTGALDRPRRGRLASATGAPAPDLGEHEDVAMALALACWFGEYAADELPVTDQADEV